MGGSGAAGGFCGCCTICCCLCALQGLQIALVSGPAAVSQAQALDPSNEFDSLEGGCLFTTVEHFEMVFSSSETRNARRLIGTEDLPFASIEDPLGQEMIAEESSIDHLGFLEDIEEDDAEPSPHGRRLSSRRRGSSGGGSNNNNNQVTYNIQSCYDEYTFRFTTNDPDYTDSYLLKGDVSQRNKIECRAGDSACEGSADYKDPCQVGYTCRYDGDCYAQEHNGKPCRYTNADGRQVQCPGYICGTADECAFSECSGSGHCRPAEFVADSNGNASNASNASNAASEEPSRVAPMYSKGQTVECWVATAALDGNFVNLYKCPMAPSTEGPCFLFIDPTVQAGRAVAQAQAYQAGGWVSFYNSAFWMCCYSVCTAIFVKQEKSAQARMAARGSAPQPSHVAPAAAPPVAHRAAAGATWTGPCGHVNDEGAKFCTGCGSAKPPPGWSCPSCGKENGISSKFCTGCGSAAPAAGWSCSSCGKDNPNDAKFCTGCGGPAASSTQESGWVCKNCGASQSDSTTFCTSCGSQK